MVGAMSAGQNVPEDTGSGSTGHISLIEQSEDGDGQLVFKIPEETVKFNSDLNTWERVNPVGGVTVKYEIYCGHIEETGGIKKWIYPDVPTFKGTREDSTPVSIPPVACLVKAYASKYLYVDSETSVFYVKPYVSKMYVSADGKDMAGCGTRSNPCATVSYALDAFDAKKNDENKVLLIGDTVSSIGFEDITVEFRGLDTVRRISSVNGFSLGRNSKVTFRNVAIRGTNGNGITLNGTEAEPSVVSTFNTEISGFNGAGISDASGGYGIINLGDNSVITGNRTGIESSGDATAGTNIFIEGKVVVDGNVSLSGQKRNLVLADSPLPASPMAKALNITGPLSAGSKIGILLPAARPDTGLPVVFTKDFERYNQGENPRTYFVYDNDDFGISLYLENGEAKIVLGGGQIDVNSPEVSFTISAAGITKSGSIYTIPYSTGGTAVRFTPHYTKQLTGQSLTGVEVILRKQNDSVVIGNSLECIIPDYGPGNFQIIIKGIYAGSEFSDTFEIKIEGN